MASLSSLFASYPAGTIPPEALFEVEGNFGSGVETRVTTFANLRASLALPPTIPTDELAYVIKDGEWTVPTVEDVDGLSDDLDAKANKLPVLSVTNLGRLTLVDPEDGQLVHVYDQGNRLEKFVGTSDANGGLLLTVGTVDGAPRAFLKFPSNPYDYYDGPADSVLWYVGPSSYPPTLTVWRIGNGDDGDIWESNTCANPVDATTWTKLVDLSDETYPPLPTLERLDMRGFFVVGLWGDGTVLPFVLRGVSAGRLAYEYIDPNSNTPDGSAGYADGKWNLNPDGLWESEATVVAYPWQAGTFTNLTPNPGYPADVELTVSAGATERGWTVKENRIRLTVSDESSTASELPSFNGFPMLAGNSVDAEWGDPLNIEAQCPNGVQFSIGGCVIGGPGLALLGMPLSLESGSTQSTKIAVPYSFARGGTVTIYVTASDVPPEE